MRHGRGISRVVDSVWPYFAVLLLAAGVFPALESRFGWRIFSVLPAIVWTYLLVMALAVAGFWEPTAEVQSAQRLLMSQLLPALLFLLMVTCDLRAILAVGPRVLATFACAMLTILGGITLVYLAFRHVLPPDGWKMLAALAATWTGGSANLVAVSHVIGLSESSLPSVLLADALCYSALVLVLFSTGALAPAFNRWSRADRDRIRNSHRRLRCEPSRPATCCCGWDRAARRTRRRAPGRGVAGLDHAHADLLDRVDRDPRRTRRRAHPARAASRLDAARERTAGGARRRARFAKQLPGSRHARRCSSSAASWRSPIHVASARAAVEAVPVRPVPRRHRLPGADRRTSPRRRCWPRRIRRCWYRSPCCSRCSGWCSARASD